VAESACHLTARRFDDGDRPSVFHASASAAAAWALGQARSGAGREHGAELRARQAAHAGWLRCVFGNPFRPAAFDPSWRSPAAVALATGMYESRDFAAMPVLADALQDAGGEDSDILGHCRRGGDHVRGCWVVDLVLGKE
jgi:hypothetical protein